MCGCTNCYCSWGTLTNLLSIISFEFYHILLLDTMFITSYNCKGLNVAKKHYIDKLLLECNICLIQEHWLLNNRLSDLNTDYNDYVTFAVSGMTEHSLFTCRPYGGCAVFIRKFIKCDSIFISCENKRICAVLCDFKSYSVLIASGYMPCDGRSTIN